MFDLYFAPCKGIRIPESGKFLVIGSGIRENFAYGIRNPGLWNPEQSSSAPLRNETQNPKKTGIQHPESRIQDCLVFAIAGRQYWTVNGELLFSFIYLPLIRSPHLKTFVNEISVRRFLPFTDCFFLLRVVSFCFHAPRDSPESKATFVSQPVNKEVGTRK